MDESHSYNIMLSQKDRHKWVHNVWFYVCEVQEQAKQIHAGRNEDRGCLLNWLNDE